MIASIEDFLISLLVVIFFMTIAWGWYLKSNNPSVVDACWPMSIFFSSSTLILVQHKFPIDNPRIIYFWICLIIWMTRLTGFIWQTRLRNHHVDQRYLELSKNWKMHKKIGYLLQYQLQGVLAVVISLPFYYIAQTLAAPSIIDYMIISFILFAIVAESVADYQLFTFKKKHQGLVCDSGFWQYSRHPNYFFEWLIWIGFAMGAINSMASLLAFVSPALLLYIFTCLTGPITEKVSINSKGAQYLNYQKKTSMIIPWFNRSLK